MKPSPSSAEGYGSNEDNDDEKADEKTPFLPSSTRSEDIPPEFRGLDSSARKKVRFSFTEEAPPPIDKEELYGLIPRSTWKEVFTALYGSAPEDEMMPMIGSLSAILFTIIGGFWLLDSLKDTVFATIVGMQYQPWAKFCSVLFTLALTLVYNTLVDMYSKPTLFYIVGVAYAIIFVSLAIMLADPTTGFQNKLSSPGKLVMFGIG